MAKNATSAPQEPVVEETSSGTPMFVLRNVVMPNGSHTLVGVYAEDVSDLPAFVASLDEHLEGQGVTVMQSAPVSASSATANQAEAALGAHEVPLYKRLFNVPKEAPEEEKFQVVGKYALPEKHHASARYVLGAYAQYVRIARKFKRNKIVDGVKTPQVCVTFYGENSSSPNFGATYYVNNGEEDVARQYLLENFGLDFDAMPVSTSSESERLFRKDGAKKVVIFDPEEEVLLEKSYRIVTIKKSSNTNERGYSYYWGDVIGAYDPNRRASNSPEEEGDVSDETPATSTSAAPKAAPVAPPAPSAASKKHPF